MSATDDVRRDSSVFGSSSCSPLEERSVAPDRLQQRLRLICGQGGSVPAPDAGPLHRCHRVLPEESVLRGDVHGSVYLSVLEHPQ